MFGSLREKLARTRNAFRKVGDLFRSGKRRDEILDELEEALILADVGVPAAETIVAGPAERRRARTTDEAELERGPQGRARRPAHAARRTPRPPAGAAPTVILMVGVNGGGKTTTRGQAGRRCSSDDGRQVVLAAADTFRAAAQEQLAIWGKRLDVPVIQGRYGADPASVVFDAAAVVQGPARATSSSSTRPAASTPTPT